MKWSRKYDSCVQCSTTNHKYMGKGLCSLCYMKIYKQRPNVKAKGKAYQNRPEVKLRKKEYDKNYMLNPKNKAKKKVNYKEYYQRLEVRTRVRARSKERYQTKIINNLEAKENENKRIKKCQQRPEYKAKRRIYNQRPDVKAKMKKVNRINYILNNFHGVNKLKEDILKQDIKILQERISELKTKN